MHFMNICRNSNAVATVQFSSSFLLKRLECRRKSEYERNEEKKERKKLRYERTLKLIQNKEKLKNDKENKIDEENTHKSMPIVEC